MFPGQSSAGPDVVSRACLAHPAAEPIADLARAVLGEARASEYLDAGGTRLRSNRDTQISVFLATQMYLAAMRAEGIEAGNSLGLSLGEYSHLVHIGAIDLDEALRLVDERGRCYDDAPPGIMATVLAVDHDTVASVVERARAYGAVAISNINAPTQHVIAGAEPAVALGGDDARGGARGARHDHRAPGADALPDDGGSSGRLRAGVGAGGMADPGASLRAECHRHANRRRQRPPTSSRTSRVTSASRCCGSAPSMAWWRPTRTPRSSRSGRAPCCTT